MQSQDLKQNQSAMHESGTTGRFCVLSASTFGREGGIQCVTRMILLCFRESWPTVEIDLLSLHDKNAGAAPEMLTEELDRGLIRHRPCASYRVVYSLAALRKMLAGRPSLVVSEHAHLGVLPWLARPMTRFPWVSLVHYAELPTLGWLRRRALRRSDLIIAVSEFAARETRRLLGSRCPRLEVCHLGLHPAYAEWAQTFTVPPVALAGRRVILIVGRMADQTRDKGHEALLRAMPEVVQQVPNVLLAIVGRGGDESRLRQLTRQLNMDQFVHFAGFVNDPQVPAYYEAAEIFAMPSFAEGFGLVYLEAMHHAKPCIAGNRDAAGEIVLDQETGLLVEPGNVAQLKTALLRLLSEPKWAKSLGAAGRARLEQNFTYGHFAARLRKLLAPFVPVPASQLGSNYSPQRSARAVAFPATRNEKAT
jgi:glycosyltransferase involved in cell wall biosynthesis